MELSSQQLGRIAGICLTAAGAIFVGVQVNHPAITLEFIGSTEFVVRQVLKVAMTVLALTGITSLYASHARRVGVVSLIGYLLFGLGYLAMFGVEVVATVVLPAVAPTSPAYVQDVVTAALGGAPAGDIGGLQLLNGLAGVGYMFGGLVFGIALFRAAVVARWASALLAVATFGTLALTVLPDAFNRPFAVPTGIALIGVGWSAWRRATATDAPATGPVRLAPSVR